MLYFLRITFLAFEKDVSLFWIGFFNDMTVLLLKNIVKILNHFIICDAFFIRIFFLTFYNLNMF